MSLPKAATAYTNQSVTNIVINASIRRQNTAEITEFIHNLEDSFSIRTLWLEWWHKLLSIPHLAALGWAFPICAESAGGLWQYCAWWDSTVGRGNSYMGQPPFFAEVRCTIQQMSSGNHLVPTQSLLRWDLQAWRWTTASTKLCERTWDQEAVPQDFKDARIVHIFKRKGTGACWDNHRGISLLSIAGKIIARVVLNRLSLHVQHNGVILPESQCGFRAGQGTTDMIFAARQIQEKCRKQHQDFYMTFIDLTKAFTGEVTGGFWRILDV